MTVERLQKIMVSRGVAWRGGCEELIASGKVKVNGLVASLGDRAQVETDRITIEGWGELSPDTPTLVYLMLNKPRGYVTTVRDQRERPTVLDLVREIPQRIFPVGRLDRDTEGLLLLTNDGALTQRLLHPSGMVQKVYLARVDRLPTPQGLDYLRQGICLEDGWTAPAQVQVVDDSHLRLTIHEGRKRQVRRMLAAVDSKVLNLERVRLGPLRLGKLPRGSFRHLTPLEVAALQKL